VLTALSSAASLLVCRPVSASGDDMTLFYINRPPLSYTTADGGTSGSLVDVTQRVMSQAGVSYHWEESSARRILTAIAQADSKSCSPGWFLTDSRRQFAVFTEKIYLEGPPIAIVNNASLSKVKSTARETLASGITLLRKDGFALIPYLEKLVDNLPQELVVHTDRETKDLAAMIGAQHGEIAFLPPSEAEYWLEKTPVKGVTALHFPDLPSAGEPRYLMCGRGVSADTLARVNHAIEALVPLSGAPVTSR
jgi:hypothetical protein